MPECTCQKLRERLQSRYRFIKIAASCKSCRDMESALAEPFVRPQLKEDLANV